MPTRDSQTPPPAASARVLSGLLAFLVFALVCAVQSPTAHAWLHGTAHEKECASHTDSAPVESQAADETGCPVTLIAQGLTIPLTFPDLLAPALCDEDRLRSARNERAWPATARLHPPAQAPPARA